VLLVLCSTWLLTTGWWTLAGAILSIVLLPSILLSHKVPQAKMAWILAVVGFPWVGPFFYVTFGRRDLRRRMQRIRGARERRGKRRRFRFRLPFARSAVSDVVREVEKAGAPSPVLGNDFLLLTEGDAAFRAANEAIRSAKHHVHLVTYMFRNDSTGRGVLKSLAEAAERGVQVRVLYDGAGTFATRHGFFQPIREAGGRAASFLPISPWVPGWRLNLRNHRKLLIVDGKVALTGGMNIGDEYHTRADWRDVHARVEGPVVASMQRVFADDWHIATGEGLEGEGYFPVCPPAGPVPIQVVASGPDQEAPLAPELMFGGIVAARESIDIITPYFVPTEPIEQALRSAARRGRRVRLMVPDFVDNILVRLATDSYLPRLIEAGVEVWRHPHMVHGKVMIVDGTWVTLGSTNLDMRSLWLNFELNIAIPHTESALAVAVYFDAELKVCRRLSVQDFEASMSVRWGRALANLMSPRL